MVENDVHLSVQPSDGKVEVAIPRSALARLSGRSHIAPEEVASAYRMEIEDIVRDKLASGFSRHLHLSDNDFQ